MPTEFLKLFWFENSTRHPQTWAAHSKKKRKRKTHLRVWIRLNLITHTHWHRDKVIFMKLRKLQVARALYQSLSYVIVPHISIFLDYCTNQRVSNNTCNDENWRYCSYGNVGWSWHGRSAFLLNMWPGWKQQINVLREKKLTC